MDAVKFWWMKSPQEKDHPDNSVQIPKLNLQGLQSNLNFTKLSDNKFTEDDTDVGSILEEINRVAAQSPLGPYQNSITDRSIEDIMKETEKVYMESSKSFEQLSQRSKTSQNISELISINSKLSTPTPKSISPLPVDPVSENVAASNYNSDYSDDFSQESKHESDLSPKITTELNENHLEPTQQSNPAILTTSKDTNGHMDSISSAKSQFNSAKSVSLVESSIKLPSSYSTSSLLNSACAKISTTKSFQDLSVKQNMSSSKLNSDKINLYDKPMEITLKNNLTMNDDKEPCSAESVNLDKEKIGDLGEEIDIRNKFIKTLEDDNSLLKTEVQTMKLELENTHSLLEKLKSELQAKSLSSPEINLHLEKTLEELKDSKEINTSLQLQLDTVNKTHQLLKSSYEDLVSSNKILERKVFEFELILSKYKSELLDAQQARDKLQENEINLNKLLEIEKLQSKSLKLQNEKDAKCIQDLNRQIKEMERIIVRKHPDAISSLMISAKQDAISTNFSSRKLLEDRIKVLEEEVSSRDIQSSKIFLEIQDKFTQMKNKYESHIDDLELHVNDLKNQLKMKTDTYDIYTQTIANLEKVPKKDSFTIAVQTDQTERINKSTVKPIQNGSAGKKATAEKDAHLLATIKGLQVDLTNKEKAIIKLNKEIEEIRKTNRRLQKEREGSLKNLNDKKEFRSYPEKLNCQSKSSSSQDIQKADECQQVKLDVTKLKQQLIRIQEDYHSLKKKRLDDLTVLQESHEREISNYVASITPLREQLELQQVSINTLQTQLARAKEELAVAIVERDHLNTRLTNSLQCDALLTDSGSTSVSMEVDALLRKVAFLERRYEEREHRLRGIIQGLAQKTISNKSCDQCAERQQQLIGYKNELDQLLATVRSLK